MAFVSNRDGTPDIYVMEGRDVRRLTNDATHESDLLWSPDGTRIAFSGGRRVWVVHAEGSGPSSLTQPQQSDFIVDRPAAWSPDGTTILYVRTFFEAFELRAVGTDGTGDAGIADAGSFPSWSPDGSKIAVLLSELGGGGAPEGTDVYLMNADGSGRTNLTNSAAFESSPAWSPDGAKIVFIAPDGIYTMNPDGSGPSRLTTRRADLVVWSSDSEQIGGIFNDCCAGSQPNEIFTVGMTGSAKRVATVADYINSVAWAPSGDRLAFSTGFEPARALFVVEADGTGLVRVGKGGSDHHSPAWRPHPAP